MSRFKIYGAYSGGSGTVLRFHAEADTRKQALKEAERIARNGESERPLIYDGNRLYRPRA